MTAHRDVLLSNVNCIAHRDNTFETHCTDYWYTRINALLRLMAPETFTRPLDVHPSRDLSCQKLISGASPWNPKPDVYALDDDADLAANLEDQHGPPAVAVLEHWKHIKMNNPGSRTCTPNLNQAKGRHSSDIFPRALRVVEARWWCSFLPGFC